jgi:hypothetical protein
MVENQTKDFSEKHRKIYPGHSTTGTVYHPLTASPAVRHNRKAILLIMPKAARNSKLNRVARRVAATAPLPVAVKEQKAALADGEPNNTQAPHEMSRGQRKRHAKRDQYLKREKMILSSLQLKSQEEQKRRIDGLDAIRDALMNTSKHGSSSSDPAEEPKQSYTTNKAKRKLVAEEVHHLNLVMQHPAFIADPFETMQEHLRNTLADEKKQLEDQAKVRSQQEKKTVEAKKTQKKKRLLGVQKKSKKKFKAGRTR